MLSAITRNITKVDSNNYINELLQRTHKNESIQKRIKQLNHILQ